MNVIELNKEGQAQVKNTLDDAAAHNFECVILIGIKDGVYRVMSSGSRDRLKIIGFLEAAKMEEWGKD